MAKNKNKSIAWILLSSVIGLIIFLIIVFTVNILAISNYNPILNKIATFLNSNIFLIIILSFMFLIGEIFNALKFPFNLPAPLFNAIGSIFLLSFIFRVFMLMDLIIGERIFYFINIFSLFIYPIVFLIVLVSGYVVIFSDLLKKQESKEKPKKSKSKTWQDVEDEFRQTVYDFLTLIRSSIKGKKQKK